MLLSYDSIQYRIDIRFSDKTGRNPMGLQNESLGQVT